VGRPTGRPTTRHIHTQYSTKCDAYVGYAIPGPDTQDHAGTR
jgi:hypothetical protein